MRIFLVCLALLLMPSSAMAQNWNYYYRYNHTVWFYYNSPQHYHPPYFYYPPYQPGSVILQTNPLVIKVYPPPEPGNPYPNPIYYYRPVLGGDLLRYSPQRE